MNRIYRITATPCSEEEAAKNINIDKKHENDFEQIFIFCTAQIAEPSDASLTFYKYDIADDCTWKPYKFTVASQPKGNTKHDSRTLFPLLYAHPLFNCKARNALLNGGWAADVMHLTSLLNEKDRPEFLRVIANHELSETWCNDEQDHLMEEKATNALFDWCRRTVMTRRLDSLMELMEGARRDAMKKEKVEKRVREEAEAESPKRPCSVSPPE